MITGDYHTHTTFSHGKGTIDENVTSAINKGLKQIAITDHGFNHGVFPIKRIDIPKMRIQILEAQDRAPIEVLLGVEANIISYDGDVDIADEDYDNFDIILCGFHKIVKTTRKKENFTFLLANMIKDKLHLYTKTQIKKNTNAYVQAMRRYNIDVITHLGRGCKVDVAQVARVAKETNTLIELNGKNLGMSYKEIMIAYNEGAKFIINTDAHKPENVGRFNKALKAITKLRLPDDAIVNLNKIPTFKNQLLKEKKEKQNKKTK